MVEPSHHHPQPRLAVMDQFLSLQPNVGASQPPEAEAPQVPSPHEAGQASQEQQQQQQQPQKKQQEPTPSGSTQQVVDLQKATAGNVVSLE